MMPTEGNPRKEACVHLPFCIHQGALTLPTAWRALLQALQLPPVLPLSLYVPPSCLFLTSSLHSSLTYHVAYSLVSTLGMEGSTDVRGRIAFFSPLKLDPVQTLTVHQTSPVTKGI